MTVSSTRSGQRSQVNQNIQHDRGKLAGKVACVTGAGTGIGVGLAIALAQAGADVAVSYFGSEDGARQTADAVKATGRRVLLHRADVAIGSEARGLVDSRWSS